ncbi:TetR family transcriptional regulator [Thiotrichales bacterium 19S11-10]|nr:TetR family transcriptional regulator [Thiotrichales bacterium 19S11-10]
MAKTENQTQQKIIKSATKLFIKNGFNGTSIRDIAKDAQVQISLIYHYFENKTALWKSVKESLLSPELISTLLRCTESDDFNSFLEQFIRLRFEAYFKNPELLRLFDWQRLEEKEELVGIKNLSHHQKWHNLENTILKFQQTKQITDQYPPKYILLMINASVFAPFMHNYHFENKQEQENLVNITIDMMKKALKV